MPALIVVLDGLEAIHRRLEMALHVRVIGRTLLLRPACRRSCANASTSLQW